MDQLMAVFRKIDTLKEHLRTTNAKLAVIERQLEELCKSMKAVSPAPVKKKNSTQRDT